MDFKISKIILWPKNTKMAIRVIPFKEDFVNVGKSSVSCPLKPSDSAPLC